MTIDKASALLDTLRFAVNIEDLDSAHFYASKKNMKDHDHDSVMYKREIKMRLKELQKQRKSLEKNSQKLIDHMISLETKMEKLLND